MGSDTFDPFLKRVDFIRMNADEESNLSPANSCRLTLLRKNWGVNELLQGHWQKGQLVEIYLWIKSLTSASDKLNMGQFHIESVEEVTEVEVTLLLTTDEGRLIKEKPERQLNQTDYPEIPNDSKNLRWPMVLGDLYESGNDRAYLMARIGNACPAFCIGGEDFKYLAYRHPNVDGKAVNANWVFQYFPEMRQLAEFGYFSVTHTPAKNEYYVDLNIPDAVGLGESRRMRVIPEKILATVTPCLNPEDAIDLDRDTYAVLQTPSSHYLYLQTDHLKQIAAYMPLWGPSYRYQVRVGFNLRNVNGTWGVQVISHGWAGNFSATGYNETPVVADDPVNNTLDVLSVFFRLGGDTTYAEIDGVHFIIDFWDDMGIGYETTRVRIPRSNSDVMFGRGYKHEVIRRDEHIKLNEIYVLVQGADDPPASYPGWAYDHPVMIIYYLLNKLAEVPEAEIDLANFNSVYTDMGSSWSFGRFLDEARTVKELLQSCLREASLKMFRGEDNKFKLFRWMRAAATPDLVFDNLKRDPLLIKNFRFYLTDAAYNWFDLEYRWNYAKGEFGKRFQRTPNGELEGGSGNTFCKSSYEKLGNVKSEYPWPQLEWIRDPVTTDLHFSEILRCWWKPATIVEFSSSLAASVLNPGDTIRTNHPGQTWLEAYMDFQVLGVEKNGNQIDLRGIECLDLGHT